MTENELGAAAFAKTIFEGKYLGPPNNAENPCASCPDKDRHIKELQIELREWQEKCAEALAALSAIDLAVSEYKQRKVT